MKMDDNKDQLNEILQKLENLHYPSGPLYTKYQKSRALLCMQDNELEAIYNLVESHTPSLRFTAVHRYERAVQFANNDIRPLSKDNINFKCSTVSTDIKIQNMLEQLSEMPKEWTIVQLTSQFNIKECFEVNPEKFYTNPIHITVFNCGKNQMAPFTVTVDPPIDQISGSVIEIRQEMYSIIKDHVASLDVKHFQTRLLSVQKQAYYDSRMLLASRLKNLVAQIQDKWLREWHCLLTGKFVNEEIEKIISSKIDVIFMEEQFQDKTAKSRSLLNYLIRGGHSLKLLEFKRALQFIYPGDQYKQLRFNLLKAIRDLSKEHDLANQLRHPLILIVDEKLDFLPWEMMNITIDQPISRMPSLHFTYALFKEHESSIVNGLKVTSPNGKYIINPGLDLKNMEIRLTSFFKYWLPKWSGIIGVMPSETDFEKMLTSSDIFLYSGHGNGTQFLAGEKIVKLRVNAVVLLFGCSSVQLTSLSQQVEMFASYRMYLIACSPCIVGMLWPVTDSETDAITAEFISQLIPSKAQTHWKFVDKKQWQLAGVLQFNKTKPGVSESEKHEPELLRAICKARKAATNYLIQAACVVRGLPVKIQ